MVTTLTSTATIDSVSLGDDGRSITCREDTGSVNQQVRTVQVAGMRLLSYASVLL